jgi:hypothetical protein
MLLREMIIDHDQERKEETEVYMVRFTNGQWLLLPIQRRQRLGRLVGAFITARSPQNSGCDTREGMSLPTA